MKSYLRYLFLVIAVNILNLTVQAQQHAKNWYFGNKAGLVFEGRYPMPLTDGQMNAREGVATISDTTGNLMFYTDGQTVWNMNHEIITQDLEGDPLSTMSGYVLPSRIHDKQFAIFTTSTITNGTDGPIVPDGGQYYILDFSPANPSGAIINDYSSLGTGPIQVRSVEKILGIPYPASIIGDTLFNPGYWILSHEFDRFTYKVSRFEEIYEPYDEINVGQQHSNGLNDFGANRGAIGYIVSSLKGDRIAVAIEGQKMFEILRFNNTTGQLSRYMQLPAGDTDNKKTKLHQAYGVAFSPSGRFLYGTSRDAGVLYQWDLSNPNTLEEVYILRSNSENPCGALQLAPNGKIYVAVNGADYVGVINHPDRLGKRADYTEYGARLIDNETGEGGTSTLGLPQFDMSEFKIQHFQYSGNCYGDTTLLMMAGGVAGGYSQNTTWTILDPETGGMYWIVQADEFITGSWVFPAPGEYDIRIQSRHNGVPLDYVERITIHENPKVKLAEDYTRLCRGDSMVLDAGNGAFYEWADESYRERKYIVTEEDFVALPVQEYRVKVTDYRGCVGWDTVHVEIKNPPVVEFEYTRSVCGEPTGSATVIPKLGVDRYFYRWEDFPENTSNKIENVPGGDYVVYVTSKFEGCESANVATVPELGVANAIIESSAQDTICPGEPVTLTIVGEGATEYQWINPAGEEGEQIVVYPDKTTRYEVRVIAREGEDFCESTTAIVVPVQSIIKPELGPDLDACEGDTIHVHAEDGFAAYVWSNSMTGQDIEILQPVDKLVLTVMDRFDCVSYDTISAAFHPAPDVYLGEDQTLCTNNLITLSGGEGQEYLWSNGETSREIEVNHSGTYWVRIGDFGCFNADTVQMHFVNPDSLTIDSVGYQDISCYGANDGRIEIKVSGTGSEYLFSLDGGTTYLDNGGNFTNLRSEYPYELAVMEDSLCVRKYEIPIQINEPEELSFEFQMTSPSCFECYDGAIVLKDLRGGTEPYTIQWSNLEFGERLSGIGVGNHSVTITDANNCVSSEQVFLDLGFRIPNAFTPNGDGQNDTWDIKPLTIYPLSVVKIFNMKGELIFESSEGYPEPWDGTFQGEPLPMGTYYYIITLLPGQKPYTGNLTLIR